MTGLFPLRWGSRAQVLPSVKKKLLILSHFCPIPISVTIYHGVMALGAGTLGTLDSLWPKPQPLAIKSHVYSSSGSHVKNRQNLSREKRGCTAGDHTPLPWPPQPIRANCGILHSFIRVVLKFQLSGTRIGKMSQQGARDTSTMGLSRRNEKTRAIGWIFSWFLRVTTWKVISNPIYIRETHWDGSHDLVVRTHGDPSPAPSPEVMVRGPTFIFGWSASTLGNASG